MNTDKPITLSVVVPAYNEQEVLPAFHRRLSAVLDSLGVTSEVVYANDGSRDGTLALLEHWPLPTRGWPSSI